MTVKFIEPGTDATGDFSFFGSTVGLVSSDNTTSFTGSRSIKCDSGASTSANVKATPTGNHNNGRVNVRVLWPSTIPTDSAFLIMVDSALTNVWHVRLNSTTNKLNLSSSGSLADGTTVISPSSTFWHRVSVAYNITSISSYTIKVWLDGNLEISVTQTAGNLNASPPFRLSYGWGTGAGTNVIMNMDDLYWDDDNSLTDPGNIRIANIPPSSLNTNNFDTLGGSGTNRYDRVSEVPINETNYIEHAAISDVQENFGIASQSSAGLSNATIVARQAWLWGKRGSNLGTVSFRTAHSANSSSVAITTPAAGDLILVASYNAGSTTIPSLDANYTNITTLAPGGSANAARLAFRISNGTETTSGTWTNATRVAVLIYRGTNGLSIGTAGSPGSGNSASLSYPTLTPSVADGSSWVAGFGCAKSATAGMNGTTTNLTQNRTSQTTINGLDTNAGVSSFSAQTLNVTGSGRWITFTVEIVATPLSNGTPKIMDNGTETAITLTTSSALYSILTTTSSYPTNAAAIGMRSSNAGPDTFLYECGMLVSYIPFVYAPTIFRRRPRFFKQMR